MPGESEGEHVKWHRVKLKGFEYLTYPPVCPNCGSPVGTRMIEIDKTVAIPLLVVSFSVRYTVNWPHCDACVEFEAAKRKRRRRGWAVGLVTLAAAAFAAIGLIESTGIGRLAALAWTFGPWLTIAAWLMWRYYRKTGAESRTRGRLARTFAVRLHNEGQTTFGGKRFLDVSLCRPEYAQQFIEANAGAEQIKYNEFRLRGALELKRLDG